jgi:hypothetical protein
LAPLLEVPLHCFLDFLFFLEPLSSVVKESPVFPASVLVIVVWPLQDVLVPELQQDLVPPAFTVLPEQVFVVEPEHDFFVVPSTLTSSLVLVV